MSTIFISGKKGGGKSLYAMKLLEEELVYGDRPVVTNIAVRWPELMQYLDDAHPSRKSDWMKRLYILQRDECYHFWRHRVDAQGCKVTLPIVLSERVVEGRKVQGFTIATPDQATGDRGVFYLIDEAQNFFSSYADWKDIGPEAMWYSEQERKWGDDEIMVTPGTVRIVKAWRDQGQEFHYMRNWGKERLGRFRGPSYFQRTIMSRPATGSMLDVSARVDYFRLDPRLAGCYDTNAGVGVVGVRGDLGKTAKGHSLLWMLPVFALIGLCVWKVPDVLAWVLVRGTGTKRAAAMVASSAAPVAAQVATSASEVPPAPLPSLVRPGFRGPPAGFASYSFGEKVVVDAVARLASGKTWIHLSDGRAFVNPENGVLAADGLYLDKEFYPVKTGKLERR